MLLPSENIKKLALHLKKEPVLEKKLEFLPALKKKTVDLNALDVSLKDNRQIILNYSYQNINIGDDFIRVYRPRNSNIKFNKFNAYGRGLDYIRGAINVLSHAGLNENKDCQKHLEKLISEYKFKIETLEGYTEAVKQTQALMGALSKLLIAHNVCQTREQANTSIRFLADYLWQKDFNNTAMCTLKQLPNNDYRLQINEPMRYKADTSGGDYEQLWQYLNAENVSQPKWFEQLSYVTGQAKNPGNNWLNSFMIHEVDILKTMPSTSMTRFAPNAANSYKCHDVIININNNISEIKHHSIHNKTAITEPLEVGETSERFIIATLNHHQMIFTDLELNLEHYLEQWQGLLDNSINKSINYSILHQTLIADEATFASDQTKAKRNGFLAKIFGSNAIDTKLEANNRIRDYLNNHDIYYDKNAVKGKKIIIIDLINDRSENLSLTARRVKINLLETNNCINMHHKRSRIRQQDVNNAGVLVNNTVENYLKPLINKISNNKLQQDLSIVSKALSRSNHSLLTRNFDYSDYEKEAIERLCKALKKGDTLLNNKVGSNLSLMIQSSAQLKRTTHETFAGAARRIIANATRQVRDLVPVLGHLFDWTVRGVMFSLAISIKIIVEPFKWLTSVPMSLWNLVTPISWHKFTLGGGLRHAFKNERTIHAKAKYEGIVAELQGQLFGGCASSMDRANEIGECRSAEKLVHQTTGKITSFDVYQSSKNEYNNAVDTVHKHNAVHGASGTPGTKEGETQGPWVALLYGCAGLASETETNLEQNLSDKASKLRAIKPKDGSRQEHYIKNMFAEVDESLLDLQTQQLF